MSRNSEDSAELARRRRLRAALDDLAPDPSQVADRGGLADANGAGKPEGSSGGLSEEELTRERPPHHGG